MIDELNRASLLLDNALDRYLKACVSTRDRYLHRRSFGALTSELSQCVASETLILGKHERKLQEARAAINRARNFSTRLVPIHLLPTEVLACIFRFALGANNIGNMPRYLLLKQTNSLNTVSSEVLAHVCSYWRHVAHSSPYLWTRIDLSPCRELSNSFCLRSAAFAERASNMPLDIYITDAIREWPASAPLNFVIESVARRIRSIDLRIYQAIRTNAYRDALSACLSYCAPGTFATLIASQELGSLSSACVFFDIPDSGIPSEHGVESHQQLYTHADEEVLLSITTMRLRGFYPFWTSKAYYGLVELRLTRRIAYVPISESHLRGILQASPGLRVLEFALNVVDILLEGSFPPIRLDCLEILNICMVHYSFVMSFLRMIEPGPRPLQLSLSSAPNQRNPRLTFTSLSTHNPFFSRAKITTLHVRCFDKDEVIGILGLCPHLQTLAWDGYLTTTASSEPESDDLISHPRLQSLYLVECEVELDAFPRWVDIPSLKNLVFYRCVFYQTREDPDPLDESQIQVELRGVNPVVSILESNMPNPVEDWGLFDSDLDP